MAGVSSISCPVPTTDSAAQPTGQRVEHGGHRGHDVRQRPGMGPGGGHHHHVGAFPERLEHCSATSPVACEATGCSDRELAKGTIPQSPATEKRMSSDRR